MIKQTTKLTQEQADTMGEEYRAMLDMAAQQLTEHKAWLKARLQRLVAEGEGGEWKLDARAVISVIDDIKLEMVRIEPAMKEEDASTVSVVYEYPDALHAFLSRPEVGKELNIAAQGGITL